VLSGVILKHNRIPGDHRQAELGVLQMVANNLFGRVGRGIDQAGERN
jgi:hypothetical protein